MSSTILEFAMGNPDNLNDSEFQSFIDSQDFLSIKQFFIVSSGIKVDLPFAVKQTFVNKFGKAFETYSQKIGNEKRAKIEALRKKIEESKTVLEFALGNPDNLNENQVWQFVEEQELITISDVSASQSGIHFYVDVEATQNEVKEFREAFIRYSKNAPIVEEVELPHLDQTLPIEVVEETTAESKETMIIEEAIDVIKGYKQNKDTSFKKYTLIAILGLSILGFIASGIKYF